MNVFRGDGGHLFALTYGEGSRVKNVVAFGGRSIETRGRVVELTDPLICTDPEHDGIPIPVRWVLETAQHRMDAVGVHVLTPTWWILSSSPYAYPGSGRSRR